jgi:hypothetical protein
MENVKVVYARKSLSVLRGVGPEFEAGSWQKFKTAGGGPAQV